MRRFLKKPRDMPVQDYIAQVTEINNTKLPDNEILDLLEFRIPIKWQRQMQVQNFKPTSGTLRDFQDFCDRLEAALDDPPADNKSNKTSKKEKDNKKHCQNHNNDKEKNMSACCTDITLHTAPNSAIP